MLQYHVRFVAPRSHTCESGAGDAVAGRSRVAPISLGRVLALVVPLTAFVLAATLPPAVVIPRATDAATGVVRAWSYWCSMLLGAASFLTAGGLVAAAAARLEQSSWLSRALPAFAMLFPGCDCAMNAYGASLRSARPAVAAFALVWGASCNPLALISTEMILGPRMLGCRVIAGLVAAGLTALAWSRLPQQAPAHACDALLGYWDSFVRVTGGGIASFSIAAAISTLCLMFLPEAPLLSDRPAFAALVGAALSPCSSADSLLARALFRSPVDQLAFVVAAQCLDVRQILLLRTSFGAGAAIRAFCAAVVACSVACFIAAR